MYKKTSERIRVLVTGATGNIAYSLIPLILSGIMLGPKHKLDLILYDLPHTLSAMRGISMEIDDFASDVLHSTTITDALETATKNVDLVLAIGAAPRTATMSRADLLEKNGKIFATLGSALGKNATEEVKILAVGNPCNTNALIAYHAAGRIPPENFFAMTKLDENRAKMQLALKAKVPIEKVTDIYIWGNHSLTQYPDFHNAKISGILAPEKITDHGWFTEEFLPANQRRGKAIIEARGFSSAFSAAKAIIDSVQGIFGLTKNPISLGSFSTGEHYDIPEGIIFSTPWQNGIVTGIQHGEFSQQKIQESIVELLEERKTAAKLGHLPNCYL